MQVRYSFAASPRWAALYVDPITGSPRLGAAASPRTASSSPRPPLSPLAAAAAAASASPRDERRSWLDADPSTGLNATEMDLMEMAIQNVWGLAPLGTITERSNEGR
jgi:hypothetical protein